MDRNSSRRRRVILDESVQSALTEPLSLPFSDAKSSAVKTKKVYSDAGRRAGQLRTTDLFPRQLVPMAIAVTACAVMAALINFLAIKSPDWHTVLSPLALQTFSWSGFGSLSAWFSSFLLLITGMASLQIYGMRRHRCDDYNGTYKVWLWMAILFLVASINCVVDFRSVMADLVRLTGFNGGNTATILLAAKFLALTALVVRGILEIRASRGAMAAVIIVWVAYATALATQVRFVQYHLVDRAQPVHANAVLIGTMTLFLGTVVYARFVYLHANGLIQIAETRKTAKSKIGKDPKSVTKSRTKAEKTSEETAKTDIEGAGNDSQAQGTGLLKYRLPKGGKSASEKESVSKGSSDKKIEQEILSLSLNRDGHLNKSEQRRLRKLEKRQNRAA